MPQVFISYQRRTSSPLVRLIHIRLKEQGIDAFVDVDNTDSVVRFPEYLLKNLEQSNVFICLLSETTLNSDWVHREIEHAHRTQKPMIPVFQESFFRRPSNGEPLPTYVDALMNYDGIRVFDESNHYIDEAIDRIARKVKAYVIEEARQWEVINHHINTIRQIEETAAWWRIATLLQQAKSEAENSPGMLKRIEEEEKIFRRNRQKKVKQLRTKARQNAHDPEYAYKLSSQADFLDIRAEDETESGDTTQVKVEAVPLFHPDTLPVDEVSSQSISHPNRRWRLSLLIPAIIVLALAVLAVFWFVSQTAVVPTPPPVIETQPTDPAVVIVASSTPLVTDTPLLALSFTPLPTLVPSPLPPVPSATPTFTFTPSSTPSPTAIPTSTLTPTTDVFATQTAEAQLLATVQHYTNQTQTAIVANLTGTISALTATATPTPIYRSCFNNERANWGEGTILYVNSSNAPSGPVLRLLRNPGSNRESDVLYDVAHNEQVTIRRDPDGGTRNNFCWRSGNTIWWFVERTNQAGAMGWIRGGHLAAGTT